MKNFRQSILVILVMVTALFSQDEAEKAAFEQIEDQTEDTSSVKSENEGIDNIIRGVSQEASAYEAAGIVNISNKNVKGAQFGLAVNAVNGSMSGIQLAVGGNFSQEMPRGAQLASLINVTGSVGYGAQFAGVLNLSTGQAGSQFAGVVNLSGAEAFIQAAGATNIAIGNTFWQSAGGVNVAGGSVKFGQFAGGVNLARANVGIQAAGGVNIAAGEVGIQMAPVNFGVEKARVQVGFVNVAAAGVGLPIGVINVVNGVPWRISFSADERGYGQVSLKTGNDYVYTILGLSSFDIDRLNGRQPEDWTPYFHSGMGLRLPMGRWLYVDADFLTSRSIEKYNTVHLEDQLRVQGGFRVLPAVAFTATVNYHADHLIQNWKVNEGQVNYQFGIELFLSPPRMQNLIEF